MKADPAPRNVKLYNLERPVVEFDSVKDDWMVLCMIKPIILHFAYNQYVVNHGRNSADELASCSLVVRLAIYLDNTRQGECNVENADPSIRLVFHMVRNRTLIGIDAHEHLAYCREASNEFGFLRDDTLHSTIGANVSQIREYWHESFRFERWRFDINWHIRVWREIDALWGHLIGEKSCDYAKQTWYDAMVTDNVSSDARNRK
jgi:hypothetical protein